MEALERVKQGVSGSLEDIIAEIKEESQQHKWEIPVTGLIESALTLPPLARKVFFMIFDNGPISEEELTKIVKAPILRSLCQLLQCGAITFNHQQDGPAKFSIRRERKLLKLKHGYIWKNFLGPTMPPIYHFNLLCDQIRVEVFRKAITATVTPDDVVADLGAGTGILALLAANKAKHVYAVEIDPFILDAARALAERTGLSGKITFLEGDACSIDLPEKIDVVICEMLDTALIREQQVPVMNHTVQNLLCPNGKVIPIAADTYVELVSVDYKFEGFDFPIPYYQKCGARPPVNSMTQPQLLHSVRFDECNPLFVDKDVSLTVEQEGSFNALRITTKVDFDQGIKLGPTEWFNPPLVLPLTDSEGQAIGAGKGEKIQMTFSYELGSGLDYINYGII